MWRAGRYSCSLFTDGYLFGRAPNSSQWRVCAGRLATRLRCSDFDLVPFHAAATVKLYCMKSLIALTLAASLAATLAACDHDKPAAYSGSSGSSQPPASPPDLTPAISAPAPPQTASDSVTALSGTGFVWKPVSESRGGVLAVLLPYGAPDQPISVNGVPPWQSIGRTNGGRYTYFWDRAGGSFRAPATLRIGGKSYTVPNPARRYD